MSEAIVPAVDCAADSMIVVHIDGEFARHGMCAMLRQLNTHVVHASSTAVELRRFLDGTSGSTVILGWDSADSAAMVALSSECRDRGAAVIFLLRAGDEDMLDRAVRVSADGYLLERDLTMSELEMAVARVAGNEVHLPAAAAGQLLESIRMGETEPRAVYGRMTPREQQVLELLVDGLSNKQIARMLHISQHGVKRLVSNVLSKLCCSNRTSAASLALSEGLVQRGGKREPRADNGLEYVRTESA